MPVAMKMTARAGERFVCLFEETEKDFDDNPGPTARRHQDRERASRTNWPRPDFAETLLTRRR